MVLHRGIRDMVQGDSSEAPRTFPLLVPRKRKELKMVLSVSLMASREAIQTDEVSSRVSPYFSRMNYLT